MVGRMDQTKDQLTLILAIKHYVEVNGSSPKLVLVGDGITRVDLELFVKENNLSNYVCFEGSQIDVHNYYSAASIFLHSSPLEGLPTTLIEAMYYGLPIIASDSIPGVREILGNNEYGVIVGLNDYIGFSDSIQELLFNKNTYNYFKSKSLLRVKDFSFEEIGSQLARVLS
jgi:glycosyltransferase involved in cell wall biosynthesis